jgi:hypothetical protein
MRCRPLEAPALLGVQLRRHRDSHGSCRRIHAIVIAAVIVVVVVVVVVVITVILAGAVVAAAIVT